MTNFQIVSDLHIEYNSNKVPNPLTLITPSADILILAGDIGSFYKHEQLSKFLFNLCPYFKVVIYIPGNHEYYKVEGYETKSMYTLIQNFIKNMKSISNLYILNKSSVQIGDVYIAGCTLWSEPKIFVPKFIVRIPEMNTLSYSQKHSEEL
jgi:predicted phosphodiesterase